MTSSSPFPPYLALNTSACLTLLRQDNWTIEKLLSETADVPLWTFYPAEMSETDARNRASANPLRAESGTGARYVIEASGRPLGTAGLVQRENSVEVFYALLIKARGRGLATLAVSVLSAWAFAHGHESVELLSMMGNLASERVAQRAGFKNVGLRTEEDGTVTRIWTLRAPQVNTQFDLAE